MPSYKTKFSAKWLSEKDCNGDIFSSYIEPASGKEHIAHCLLCKRSFNIAHQGRGALIQHAKTEQHKTAAAVFFKRSLQRQISFSRSETAPVVTTLSSDTASKAPGTFVVSTSKNACDLPERHTNQVAAAEIRLVLAAIEGNIGYKTLETILPTLKMIDPNSKVWQDISLGQTKASYSASDAIGPYFHEKSIQSVRQAFGFSLSLDSATTKRGGLTKELDLHVIFWDSSKGQVVTRLLSMIEMTSETAVILKKEILTHLKKEGVVIKRVLAISLRKN
jgi:hypothetical protein